MRVANLTLSSGIISIRSFSWFLFFLIFTIPVWLYLRNLTKNAFFSEEYFLNNRKKLIIIGFCFFIVPGVKIILGRFVDNN